MINPDMANELEVTCDLQDELFGEEIQPLGNNACDGREDFEKFNEDDADLYMEWEKMREYQSGIEGVCDNEIL